MATWFHHLFNSTSRFINRLQTGGAVDVDAGRLRLIKDSGTYVDGWGDCGCRHTSDDNGCVIGGTVYWQASVPTTGTTMMVGVSRTADYNQANVLGVLFNGATNKFALWDGAAGADTAESFSAGTVYDFRGVFNASKQLVVSYRATTAAGNLPASTGSWTSLGTTTNAFGTSFVYFQVQLYTALAAGNYAYCDEYYHTTDGNFTTQTARSSSNDSDTCDTTDGWVIQNADGTISIDSGAIKVIGGTGSYSQAGIYRATPQTTQTGAYFYWKWKTSSGAAANITMIGLGDSRETNNWHYRNSFYIDTGNLYFYDVSSSTLLEALQTNTWYYCKAKVNADGTATYYYNTTSWYAPFTTAGTTSAAATSFNHLTDTPRLYLYQDRASPITFHVDDYGYNPTQDSHPLFPTAPKGGTAQYFIALGCSERRSEYGNRIIQASDAVIAKLAQHRSRGGRPVHPWR